VVEVEPAAKVMVLLAVRDPHAFDEELAHVLRVEEQLA
jgi:hypothetical protein